MGQTLKNRTELLNATSTVSVTGASVTMIDNREGFIATITAATVGGTTPTFDAVIEHSDDGVNWYNLTTFTQITVDSTEVKVITSDVLEFIRYDLVVTGTTPTADLVINFNYNDVRKND